MSLTDYSKKEKEEDYEVIELKKLLKEKISTEKRLKQESTMVEGQEFKPTLKNPFFQITTKQGKDYSIWHKPRIYLPYNDEIKIVYPDFIFINEKTDDLYELKSLKKEMKAHKHLTKKARVELTEKLLKKIKKPALLLYLKKSLTQKELKKVIMASTYLKPEHVLVIAENYLKPEIKLSMPEEITYVENAGMNKQKAKEEIEKII